MSEQPMWKAGDRVKPSWTSSDYSSGGVVTQSSVDGVCHVRWQRDGIERRMRDDFLVDGAEAKPPVDEERVWALSRSYAPGSFLGDGSGSAEMFTQAEAEAICAEHPDGDLVVVRHPACPEPEPATKRPFKVGDRVRVKDTYRVAIWRGETGTIAEVTDKAATVMLGAAQGLLHFKDIDRIDAEPAQPAPTAPATTTQPAPRCGQTWEILPTSPGCGDTVIQERGCGASHRIHRGGQTFDIYDRLDDTFRIRLDDGIRTQLPAYVFGEVGMVRFISGPTTPETPREELERVVKLESATPPEGVTPREWLVALIGRSENTRSREMTAQEWRASAQDVRAFAAQARDSQAVVRRLSVDGYGRIRS